MLDQLYGRPSSSWKRTQVILVLLFWMARLRHGNASGPPLPFFRRMNRWVQRRFTPWQVVLSTLTAIYAIKNTDSILGLTAPEPLARLYSRNYYRATWIVTALDAGFATAMPIRPKWIRDIFSVAFAGYYLLFANEADEKLRKYRAMCTVEMLRATWEKTSNPYLRLITRGDRPKITIHRRILLPRPKGSKYTKPITAWIFYDGTELELSQQTDLIFDIPGGGFICMTPEHHEERLLRWAIKTRNIVVSFDYGKAPEYPFPFAIDEMYDAYKLLQESKGKVIGMSGTEFNVVVTGDSAGANIATALTVKILETRPRLPLPVSLVYAYAALSFHFTSWMPASDLKVLRQESSSNVASLLAQKAHHAHRSPLSVVEDVPERPKFRRKRTSSWGRSLGRSASRPVVATTPGETTDGDDEKELAGLESDEVDEQDKSLSERVVWWDSAEMDAQLKLQTVKDEVGQQVLASVAGAPLETRLAMTSRTAFFNDRIISPPMCRAMALLYIGPRNAPDLHSDYHISPIFTPPNLLAQFPPVYLSCGERDPFVDDTVIFAGKLREAKEAKKLDLLAKGAKFGESLRMSIGGSSAASDPIVDQVEEDWVQMRILSGWSHGYLQMTAVLPEAWSAVDMLGEWITDSFEKVKPSAAPAPARALSDPSSSHLARRKPLSSPPPAAAVAALLGQSSDDDDAPLSFTPKRRNSRTSSPAPSVTSGSSSSITVARTSGGSSSDDTAATSVAGSAPLRSKSPPRSPNRTPSDAKRRFTEPVRPHLAQSVMSSDEEVGLAPPRLTSQGIRRGSSGTADKEREPSTGGVFVDPNMLLNRRRHDVVFGISQTNSAVASDDEDENAVHGRGGAAGEGRSEESG